MGSTWPSALRVLSSSSERDRFSFSRCASSCATLSARFAADLSTGNRANPGVASGVVAMSTASLVESCWPIGSGPSSVPAIGKSVPAIGAHALALAPTPRSMRRSFMTIWSRCARLRSRLVLRAGEGAGARCFDGAKAPPRGGLGWAGT
eukprot:scaffold14549_cov48-Phaeocystis_antarctica.AAC.2